MMDTNVTRKSGPRPYFRKHQVPDPAKPDNAPHWLMRGAAVMAAFAMVFSIFTPSASAEVTVPWEGNGTNEGLCSTVQHEDEEMSVEEGMQVWQFNLTKIGAGPHALTAEFSDDTSVSGEAPDVTNGGVAKWYVTTEADATLESASAVDGTLKKDGSIQSNLTVSHCWVHNEEEPSDETATVTIVKYLDGEVATAETADSTSFAMHAMWDDPTGIGTGEGDFNLSTTGFNNPTAYYATTSEMDLGADYSVHEVMNSTVAETCEGDEPYALEGYSTGATLEAAAEGAVSGSASLTDIQSDMFIVVHNESCDDTPPVEDDTMLHFIKVVCDEYSDVAGNESGASADASGGRYDEFSNYNGGAFTPSPLVSGFVNPSEIPGAEDGCARADGWQFKLSSDQGQTANVMTTPATSGGEYSTNVSDLPDALETAVTSGQLWVSEVMEDSADFAAIRCYNDALNGDNLEFISLGDATPEHVYCIAYNVEEDVSPDTVNVTIVKHVDGEVATAVNTDSASFAMHASWDDPTGIGTGEGDFNLSTTGFNNPTAYHATTSEMDLGADYSVSETLNSTVGDVCGNTPFEHIGYTTGSTYAEAAAATPTSTVPSFTNLQDDRVVVVWNEACGVLGDVDTNIHFIKVVCDDESDVPDHPQGIVSPSEIPGDGSGCARADGWQFKLSTDSGQTLNVMDTTATASGEFMIKESDLSLALETAINGSGIWVSEINQDDYDFAAIRCYDDAANDDNLEILSIATEGDQVDPTDVYCIAYNIGEVPTPDDTVTVTIVKYLDGSVATADSADDTAFPMHASWDDPTGIGTGEGHYTLSPSGFNNANAYYATTSEMDSGADYATNEVFGDIVAADCTGDEPYALTGYSMGNTFADAQTGTVTTTAPSFDNLQSDKFVIVHNRTCGVLGDNDTRVHFIKAICEDYGDIKANFNPGYLTRIGDNWELLDPTPPFINGQTDPGEISENCTRADGWQFKLSSDLGQTADVMITPATSGGEYSTMLSDLPEALENAAVNGQLWVSEVEQDGYDFVHLRCHNNGAYGDNLEEISLDGGTPEHVYCIAYNMEEEDTTPDTVNVTIVKHLDGEVATAETADSTSFAMHAMWDDPTGIGTGEGDFNLSTTGFNNPTAYYATTSEMDLGADYSVHEVMNSTVGEVCGNTPYQLIGYTIGDNYAEAAAATPTGTVPDFTNLQDDKVVIVWNESCGVLGDVDTRIHFIKVVCDEEADVPAHPEGNVEPTEIPGIDVNCARANGWQFLLSSDSGQLENTMITTATSGGEFSLLESELPAALQTAIAGDGIWVSEVNQDNFDFAAVRCYDDALNDDNLEVLSLALEEGQTDPNHVYCIAYNIGEVPTPEPCPDPTQVSIVSGTSTQFLGYVEGTMPDPLNDEADFTGGTDGAAVAADDTGFPGAWDAASNDPNISGTGAIWVSDQADQPSNPGDPGDDGSVNSWRLFEHEFIIPAGSTDITDPATLYFTADNSVTVFLDGAQIASHDSFGSVDSVVLPTLTAGTHTLTFVVKNDAFDGADNPTGLLYALNFSYCEEEDDNGGGGGSSSSSSSGSRRNNNDNDDDEDFGPGLQFPGAVLGDVTTIPSTDTAATGGDGEVLGDSTTLPRTGTALTTIIVLAALAGLATVLGSKQKLAR